MLFIHSEEIKNKAAIIIAKHISADASCVSPQSERHNIEHGGDLLI